MTMTRGMTMTMPITMTMTRGVTMTMTMTMMRCMTLIKNKKLVIYDTNRKTQKICTEQGKNAECSHILVNNVSNC